MNLLRNGPSAVTVHPSGVEKTLHERIHELKGWDGDKRGKMFWVWVDRVLSTQTGSSITWLVDFNKWEPCGEISLHVLLYQLNLCIFSI
ncbi:hypothetical protein SLEP1_g4521 [Rubroshorea leprosula]|uniref:Sucrose-phosphatase C-terminal domain-containing protein n=1 Tax=Rubroshorea leprosula TaxID=152421 RepID=A0AAV5HTA1_9ROSI|nr:hypothetical protein SLEP1_g4521 [Rubroshorea leprosula]